MPMDGEHLRQNRPRRLERTDQAYATTDGRGRLAIATPSGMDPDDCVARDGAARGSAVPWCKGETASTYRTRGLCNETARDVILEHACAAPAGSSARSPWSPANTLAPTTDYRAFYDALPPDPFAARDAGEQEEVLLARAAYARRERGRGARISSARSKPHVSWPACSLPELPDDHLLKTLEAPLPAHPTGLLPAFSATMRPSLRHLRLGQAARHLGNLHLRRLRPPSAGRASSLRPARSLDRLPQLRSLLPGGLRYPWRSARGTVLFVTRHSWPARSGGVRHGSPRGHCIALSGERAWKTADGRRVRSRSPARATSRSSAPSTTIDPRPAAASRSAAPTPERPARGRPQSVAERRLPRASSSRAGRPAFR